MATSSASGDVKAAPAYPEKDCLACRLSGSLTFTGIGAYALYEAKKQGAFAKIRPKGSPLIAGKVTAVFGIVFIGLGLGRLVI